MAEFDNRVPGAFLLGVAAASATIGIPFGQFGPLAFIFALIPTLIVGGLIGVPLFYLATYKHMDRWWTAILAGIAAGEAVPIAMFFFDPSIREAMEAAALFGASGAVGGLAFWLWARHGPRLPFV